MDKQHLTCVERSDARHVLRNIRQYVMGIYADMEGQATRAVLVTFLDAMLIELGALRDRLRGLDRKGAPARLLVDRLAGQLRYGLAPVAGYLVDPGT
jgi:hypothetical protein